jgi:carbohydrate-selective porin OprB
MGGLYNGDPSIHANKHHGLDWSMDGPLFAIGEIGYQRNGLPNDPGRTGNYKAGFWYDNSQFTDFNTVARGHAPAVTRGEWGYYGLFDQVLFRFGEPGAHRGLGVTGSVLIAPDQSVSQMPFFSNAGFLFRGLFPSRPWDGGGFGVVFGQFSNDLQDSQRRARQTNPSVGVQRYETALELTYRFGFLGDALRLQPDLQYIIPARWYRSDFRGIRGRVPGRDQLLNRSTRTVHRLNRLWSTLREVSNKQLLVTNN